MWRELLLHFFTDWAETRNMLPLRSADVRDTIFMFISPGIAELRNLELRQKIAYNAYLLCQSDVWGINHV